MAEFGYRGMRHIDGSWIMFWVSWNVHSSSGLHEMSVKSGREGKGGAVCPI